MKCCGKCVALMTIMFHLHFILIPNDVFYTRAGGFWRWNYLKWNKVSQH